ncbi:hypothetical protein L2E82_40537 [Cichorium intybus]|uniref:Uncharacterized protein n=1 Tax=Cichorium intybus TaxID=13427 RepID=A0ACB9AM81_CICIN|nr:hypothetical protein L2E82_40537 [Cichorium intybus]
MPNQLWRRFPYLESLKLKGEPRATMYNMIPEDWGGFVTPWVEEFAGFFTCLKVVHFRRMKILRYSQELVAMFFNFLSLISALGFPPMDSFIFLASPGNLENEEVLVGLVAILLWVMFFFFCGLHLLRRDLYVMERNKMLHCKQPNNDRRV